MISIVTSCCGSPSRSPPQIVGEAAKQVSRDLRESHPQVPWSVAARMRDRLVHHYFDVNLDVLWSTVTNDLPRLLATLPTISSVMAPPRWPAIDTASTSSAGLQRDLAQHHGMWHHPCATTGCA